MNAGLTINGLDLGLAAATASDGSVEVTIATLGGWWDGIGYTPSTTDAGLGRLGPGLRPGGTAAERRGTVTLIVTAATPSAMRLAVRQLLASVPVGVRLAVGLDLVPDREWRAHRLEAQVTHVGSPSLDPWATVTLVFGGGAPVACGRAHRIVGLASSDAAPTLVPLGTLPVLPRVRLTAGETGATGSTVTLAVTDLAGRPVPNGSITLTAGLSGREWLDVDMATAVITEHLAGAGYVGAYAGGRRTAGDYLALDPADGPAVAVTTPTGSARALLCYRPLWDA